MLSHALPLRPSPTWCYPFDQSVPCGGAKDFRMWFLFEVFLVHVAFYAEPELEDEAHLPLFTKDLSV